MASSLPTELHEVIFQHLEIRDLSTLCTVSRRVQIEAERLLYRNLSLPQIKHLKAWCFVVTRRPEIALHIRSLSITMPPIVGFCLSDLPGFTQNLKLCTNLRELEMHGSGDYSFLSSHTFHPWLLEGASFRLTKFVNTYFAASSLLGFLASQPDISILTLPSPSESITLPNTILPNLRVVDLDWDTLKLIENPRKIEHARINLSWLFGNVQADVFWPLRSFPCLKSVTVKKRQAHYISMAVIVTFIAEALPELKDFTIVDDDIFKVMHFRSNNTAYLLIQSSGPRLSQRADQISTSGISDDPTIIGCSSRRHTTPRESQGYLRASRSTHRCCLQHVSPSSRHWATAPRLRWFQHQSE